MVLVSLIVIFSLVVSIISLVIIVRLIAQKKKFKTAIAVLSLFIISLFSWAYVRDRSSIILNFRHPLYEISIHEMFQAYANTHHRFPMSINEIVGNRTCDELLMQKDKIPSIQKPFFLPQPSYGIKTWFEDTVIYSAFYSYGLDYDDDSLHKKYHFILNTDLMNTWEYAKYILIPFCDNGDIIVFMIHRHVNDPRLDTTFVHKIRKLHGDTLSSEQYERWLKKREEFFDNEKSLN